MGMIEDDHDHIRNLIDAEERRLLRLLQEEACQPLPIEYKIQMGERRKWER
jgi:hypothetical protein